MDISQYLLAVPRLSFYVAIVDYGAKLGIGPTMMSGNPEATRADIVSEIREHVRNDGCVVSVKWIEGSFMQDVTEDILTEAIEQIEPEPVDLRAIANDHFRDLRKHEAVS